MCSLSKRSASSLTVMARRSASRLAAGSSPFLVAAMIVIARVRACSQVSTVLGPRLMRRDRRPARYCTMYLLRPLGSTRSPKPGSSSSQMKCSLLFISAASTTRLVSFGMSAIPYDAQSASCRRPRSPVEALWKQEGENRGANLRKPTWSQCRLKSTKSLKMRRKRKFRAIVRSMSPGAHNLQRSRAKSCVVLGGQSENLRRDSGEGGLRLTPRNSAAFRTSARPLASENRPARADIRSDAAISAATLRVIPGGFSNISFVSDIAFVAIDAHSMDASIWEELGHGNRSD